MHIILILLMISASSDVLDAFVLRNIDQKDQD